MTVNEYFRQACAELGTALGSEAEGEAAARIVLEDVAGYDRKYLFMYPDRELLDETRQRIQAVVDRIKAGEPVQYAVGRARFMGMDFKVTPDVLIPRPETEGLCDMIVREADGRSDLRVLDIGTGSGCIAVSLARELPFAQVDAMDVSPAALAVARENAQQLGAKVNFIQDDILTAKAPEAYYDIIVSNPPYVCQSEKADMDERVSDREPALALFVPDDDPLKFYRAICRYASRGLKPGGRLYFEINSRFPVEMRRLMEDEGFTDVDVTRDYKGNYRFASGKR
ncbi:MAG: peptide chain release factor N(5)-glutamine methyltransferase [Bacteroidales bacterium]|nr:peptide chain release factor N(5)-glutamine methyltransferase [Bacteroidales bacterium]